MILNEYHPVEFPPLRTALAVGLVIQGYKHVTPKGVQENTSQSEQYRPRFPTGRARNCQCIERDLALVFLQPAFDLKSVLNQSTSMGCWSFLLKSKVNHHPQYPSSV